MNISKVRGTYRLENTEEGTIQNTEEREHEPEALTGWGGQRKGQLRTL